MKFTFYIIISIILVLVISLALLLGIALGIGWLLTQVLPFTLFEGAVLGMFATAIIGSFLLNIIRGLASDDSPLLNPDNWLDEDDEDEEDDEHERIPSARFYKNASQKTWEAKLRYEIANDIYADFQDAPYAVSSMGTKQTQELAIRLADIALAILKRKTSRARQLAISKAQLKQQMDKMGQRHYAEDIMSLALTPINDNVDYFYDELLMIIREGLWEASAD